MAYNVPVLVVVFNRPDLAQKLFDVLSMIKPECLYIAADSPRLNHPEDVINCKKTRDVFDRIDWHCSVQKKYNDTNLGCDTSIREALIWFFGKVEYGIVLEDDCIPNLSFFHFCKTTLERHKEDSNIALVCGSNNYDKVVSKRIDYFTSDLMYTWGWASWSRFVSQVKWYTAINNSEAQELLEKHYGNKEFVDFYKNILNYFISQPNKNKPWDVDFLVHILTNNFETILPSRNMIRNLGYEGTHYSGKKENLLFSTPAYEYPDGLFPNYEPLPVAQKNKLMKSLVKKANSFTFRDKLYLIKQRIKKLLKISS